MSKIQWTERTWNPLAGCSKISEGCKNCYAIRMAYRLQHIPAMATKYAGTVERTKGSNLNWTGHIYLDEVALKKPISIKSPTLFFVNSMSDLFHEDVPYDYIDKVFAVMALTPHHTYQVLTKRAGNMAAYFKHHGYRMAKIMDCIDWWGDEAKRSGNVTMAKLCEVTRNRMNVLHPIILPNVWMGVSVENQEAADERISYLLQVPAKVRFLSCEPLLGPIDLHKAAYKNADGSRTGAVTIWKGCGVNWVIAGGESGPGARPSNPDWYRRLRDDCKAANVPFFFKQWGEYAPADVTDSTTIGNVHPKHVYSFCYGGSHPFNCGDADGGLVYKIGKRKSGRLLDGVLHDEMPAR